MKQLKLPIEWIHCRHYQNCDAPLCPEDPNVRQCIWFPGEPVCRLKNAPEWVAKQRKIARLKGIDSGKYFTVRILEKIREITPEIEGADPELFEGEKAWLARQSRAGKIERSRPSPRRKPSFEPGNYTLF
ncbi:MAG: hypothetical protein R6U37_02700 [Dehalococcoidia bacterium]